MAKKKVVDTGLMVEVDRVIPLHKVGINWFGRCPYCGDVGSHFLAPWHCEYWQCLSCGKKGVEAPKIEVRKVEPKVEVKEVKQEVKPRLGF